MLCHCPKLTPLQSRLLASMSALALLALIYWSLSNPHFAYAAELSLDGSGQPRNGEDHNWHRILEDGILEENAEGSILQEEYRIKRAANQTQVQGNNIATPFDVDAGGLTIWEYPERFLTSNHTDVGPGMPSAISGKESLRIEHHELRRRQDGDTTIYISANTCSQPTWSGSGIQDVAPPQLTLYVSTSAGNQELGPDGTDQDIYVFDGGFVNASVSSASGDWYVAVGAPELPSNFSGSWNYELAVSIDDYFYAAAPDASPAFLYLVDTDSDSALLVTDNLTQADPSSITYQQWANLSAPFVMFAMNKNLTGYMGLENSFCGLQTFKAKNDQIQASQNDLQGNTTHVQMGMITRGLGNKPKQQFYVTDLNSSSEYIAFVAMQGNSTASGNGVVQGGGKVWGRGANFTTKSDGNCQLLFNLTFCDEVAYAVPANPANGKFSTFADLQLFYENYTSTWYTPFTETLAQIPCNTTSDAQYSLAKTCTNCAAAYKEWLCAVSIPRCEDFSNPADFLQIRNVGQPFFNNDSMLPAEFLDSNYVPMIGAPTVEGSNAFEQTYASSFATNRSRNSEIDTQIRPGPYKELLPCEDLCYSLMQSCPAAIGFACPYRGRGLEASYGKRSTNGDLTCSYLGAVYYQNGAEGNRRALVWRAVGGAALLGLAFLVWI